MCIRDRNIPRHQFDTLRRHHSLFTVDVPDHFICDFLVHIHCFDIVHTERQDILVINSIHNSVGMQLVSNCLLYTSESKLILAGELNGQKARIKLMLALGLTSDIDKLCLLYTSKK